MNASTSRGIGLPPARTVHEERASQRARLVQLRDDLAHAERRFLALGAGEPLTGAQLILERGGASVVVSAAVVHEIVGCRPGPGDAEGDARSFEYRGQRHAAADLAALAGGEPGGPAPLLVVFSCDPMFAIRADEARLVLAAPRLIRGDPGLGSGCAVIPRLLADCGAEVLPLLDVAAAARAAANPQASRAPDAVEEEFERIERRLEERGLSLSRRLRTSLLEHCRRAALEGRPRPYLPRILGGDPFAACTFLDHLVQGDTRFFRAPDQLAALSGLLFEAADPGQTLRLWSAGCGSGEEAYSLAMLLADARPDSLGDRVLGTDVAEQYLEHARAGRYGRTAWEGGLLRKRFLLEDGPELTVAPEVRRRVEFRRADAREPPPGRHFDAVVCRNVLCLLTAAEARRALANLVRAIRPGGYLLLGPTETELGAELSLERIERGAAVLFRRPPARRAAPRSAPRSRARPASSRGEVGVPAHGTPRVDPSEPGAADPLRALPARKLG